MSGAPHTASSDSPNRGAADGRCPFPIQPALISLRQTDVSIPGEQATSSGEMRLTIARSAKHLLNTRVCAAALESPASES